MCRCHSWKFALVVLIAVVTVASTAWAVKSTSNDSARVRHRPWMGQ